MVTFCINFALIALLALIRSVAGGGYGDGCFGAGSCFDGQSDKILCEWFTCLCEAGGDAQNNCNDCPAG